MKFNEIVTESFHVLKEGARIAHAEDLVFYEKSSGASRAVDSLMSLGKSRESLTIKWDGRPAIVFGRNDAGEFVMTDKSGFTAKGYDGKVTSAESLRKMIGGRKVMGDPASREQYINTLASIWSSVEKAVPAGYRGYVLGDIMYFSKPKVNKSGYYEFTPNTVTYEVKTDSMLGKRVGQSEVGIAVHTYFADAAGEGQPLTNTAGLNVNGPCMIFGPEIKVDAPLQINASKAKEIKAFVKKNAKYIDGALDEATLAEKKMAGFPDVLYTFVNAMTKTRDLTGLADRFEQWVSTNPKISKPMAAKIVDHAKENRGGVNAIFATFEAITTLKADVIQQLDAQSDPVRAHIAGQPGGEGYVQASPDGNIKLVNRLGFSASNFEANS